MSTRLKLVVFLASLTMICNAFASSRQPQKSGMGFTYYEMVENPGSKSAGIRGILLFNDLPINRDIGDIRTPIGSFTYIRSNLLFRPQGWFPIKDIIAPNTTESITTDMRLKGSYPGSMRIGTPDNWCYLPRLGIWSDPKLLVPKQTSHPLLDETANQQTFDVDPACRLKPERGPCKALFEVYYYDSQSNRCRVFFWGGCQGVAPFKNEDECRKKCVTTSIKN